MRVGMEPRRGDCHPMSVCYIVLWGKTVPARPGEEEGAIDSRHSTRHGRYLLTYTLVQ